MPGLLRCAVCQGFKFLEQRYGVNRVQILRHTLHVVRAQVGYQQAQRTEYPRKERNIHLRHTQIVGQRRRVQRA